MPPHLTVHRADGTQIGAALTTKTKKKSNRWRRRLGDDGSGSFTAKGDIDPAQLAETVIVRVNDGTRDVFAIVPTSKNRRTLDSPGHSEVDLAGPGVRWLLHAAQVLQEDTSDCAVPSDARWLGWMSAAYDDAAWGTASSYGTYSSGPWDTPRPEGWKDPDAEYVWSSTAGPSDPGDCYFRWTFTVTEEIDVALMAAADDEYQLFLDGTEMFSTLDRGAYQWERPQRHNLRLCPGTHVVAVLGRNLERILANLNYGWVLWSIMPVDENGEPIAVDQRYKVYHDHTAGTFTLTADGQTTAPIPWDAPAADVRSALEALTTVGVGNATVSGTGTWETPWDVTFTGDLASSRVVLTGDPAGLTGGTALEIDEHARGSSGEPIAHSDLSAKVLAYPEVAPGLTVGEILRLLVEEAAARGASVFDHLTLDFSDPLDTAGVAWPEELTFPVPLPADVHRVTVMLEEMGYDVDVSPDLRLQCWAERGVDRSGMVTLAPWTAGVDEVSAGRNETPVMNAIRYRAGTGWFEEVDAGSVAARDRWEAGIRLESFPTRREALGVVGPLLDDLAEPPRRSTITITSEAAVVPHDDFELGDVVTGPVFDEAGFEQVAVRVMSIGGAVNELSISWTVEVVD